MAIGDYHSFSILLQGKLYMFGGFSLSKTLRNVEVLDTRTRSWKPSHPLLVGSSFHSSVLIPRLWFDGNWGKIERLI